MSLETIEALTKAYATERIRLSQRVTRLKRLQESIYNRLRPGILTAADSARRAKQKLEEAIDLNREHFQRPKTKTFSNIRVGLRKGSGKMKIKDTERTIQLIREKLPEKAKDIIKIKESVPVKNLDGLSARELKSIGVTVESDTEEILIKDQDTEIDKIVKDILDTEPEE